MSPEPVIIRYVGLACQCELNLSIYLYFNRFKNETKRESPPFQSNFPFRNCTCRGAFSLRQCKSKHIILKQRDRVRWDVWQFFNFLLSIQCCKVMKLCIFTQNNFFSVWKKVLKCLEFKNAGQLIIPFLLSFKKITTTKPFKLSKILWQFKLFKMFWHHVDKVWCV